MASNCGLSGTSPPSTRFAVLWLAANTGMRRGGLLGFRWGDIDLDSRRLSVNRALSSVGYELH